MTPSGSGDGVGVSPSGTEVAPGTGGPQDGAGVGGPIGVGDAVGLGVGDALELGVGDALGLAGGVTAEPAALPGGDASILAYAGWPPSAARAAANASAKPPTFRVWQTKRRGGLSLDNIPYLSGFRPFPKPP